MNKTAMKIKSVEMLILFDFYGEVLTDKQKELFDLYYNEDMSLAEISENTGITRQAVRDAVIRAEQILKQTELRLGLARRYGNILPCAQKISDCFESIAAINKGNYQNSKIQAYAESGIELANQILTAEKSS